MKARSLAIACTALGIVFLLGSVPAHAGQDFELSLYASQRKAKQFLETTPWERYDATRINIAEEKAWEELALFLDLKGDGLKVEFPNDRFYHASRRHYGDLAEPEAVEGDVEKTALELLERNHLKVYRFSRKSSNGEPDTAIILTPYTVKATLSEETVKIRLDEEGLYEREGDDPGHDLSFLGRMGKAWRSHRGSGHKKGDNGKKEDDEKCYGCSFDNDSGDTFYGRYFDNDD